MALIDACACVADVLTFYQERIANEGFLRTATERRSVLELAGIHDILTKSLGTSNPINVVYATIEALRSLRTAEQVAKLRDKTVAELFV